MDGKQVSVEELKRLMAADVDRLAQEVAAALNAAKEGRIIADTEEVVRDAHAQFRERVYAQAIRLPQSKQEAFSPSVRRASEQGPATDHPSDSERASERVSDSLLVGPERDLHSDGSVAGPDGASG